MANIGEGAAWRVQQNKLETYLVGTVTDAPPSSATEEAGAVPGQPEPNPANTGTGEVTLTGTGYRGTNLPTVEIRVTDHAHIAADPSRIALNAANVFVQRATVRNETFQSPDPISGNRALVKLPRIAILRTNNDASDDDVAPAGITQEFNPHSYISLPSGYIAIRSATVELPDGSWLLFSLWEDDGAPPSAWSLTVYRYAQWTDTAWQLIYGPIVCPKAAGLTAIVVDGMPYLYLAANESEVGAALDESGAPLNSGRLYVYRFSGTTVSTGTDPGTLSLVAGPILVSTITSAANSMFAVAACPLRSGVFVAISNDIGSGIAFGYSADQRNWGGSDERHGRFVTLGDFASVFFDPSTVGDSAVTGEIVTDLKMISSTVGWFCTDGGRIFTTNDAGKTWNEQSTPVNREHLGTVPPVPLYAIAAQDTSTVMAFGAAGLILSTSDGGATWQVLRFQSGGTANRQRIAIADSDWVTNAIRDPKTATDLIGVDLYCAEWLADSSVIICGGQDGYLFRSTDAGVTWTELLHNGPGAYRGLAYIGTTLHACGDWDVHRQANVRTWFVSIADITTTPGTPSYNGPNSRARSSMVAMTVGNGEADDWLFAVEDEGRLYRFAGSSSGPEAWHLFGRVPSRCTDIVRLYDDPSQVFVITPDGVWRTSEATVASPSQPQFFAQQTLTQQNQVGYWFDPDNGIVAGRGVQRTDVSADLRYGGALVPLDDGNSVVFACNNVTQQFMEIWLISDVTGSPTVTLVDGRNIYDVNLKPGGTYPADYGAPAATRAASGEIIIVSGVGVRAPTVVQGAVGAGNGIKQYAYTYRKTATFEETGRSKASTITLVNRQATLTFVAAPTNYTVEIYRADGFGHPFYWIASVAAGTATYTDNNATPNLMRSAPHQSGARVNPDGTGRTWVWPDDPSLPIPVGSITSASSWNTAEWYRTLMAVRGGRLVSVITTANWILAEVARDWVPQTDDNGRTHYAPIYPGVEQWLLDDLFVLIASPQPGDAFTIAPRYTYNRARIADESPSIDWRSSDNDNQVIITWDRTDPDIVAVLGPGDLWEASAFALINTNFRAVEFRVSVGAANPVDAASYSTSGILNCDVDTGVISAMVGSNILGDATKHWIPDQWAPGMQTFYLLASGALPAAAYRILGNSENSLTLERPSGASALSGFYSIFADRFFWGGSTASHGALASTIYRFGRYVQVVIPAQPTADGYRRIGTAIVGAATSTEVPATAEETAGRGYAWDSRWRPITNTEEQTAQTGISRVRHFGRTGQLWTLPYEAVEGWRRDQLLNPLLRGNRLRKAFVVVFDATNQASARLVRLVDASEYAATLRDRYSWATALKEIC